MRLNCSVKVHNRNLGGNPRACASTLALVRGAKDSECSFLIHFKSAYQSSKRYKISNNVAKVFNKFSGEGKTTISFKEPEIDLMVQADPLQLKVFLRTLSICLNGIKDQSRLTSFDKLSSLGVLANKTPSTKLVLHSAADIPIKGLPRTVQTLHLIGMNMNLFKREILSLRSLRILDLSKNSLKCLPRELGDMPLNELVLSDNKLGYSSLQDWKWIEGTQIKRTLRSLDVSSNALSVLPKTISKLQNLVCLKANDNQFKNLPMGLGSIRSLRFLSVAKNRLRVLPASLTSLRLEKADFSCNHLCMVAKTFARSKFKVNTLVELSSSAVIGYKIAYASNLIPFTLTDYLDNAYYCICGKPNFNHFNYTWITVALGTFCESVTIDRSNYASFDCYLCSVKCHNYCSKMKWNELLDNPSMINVNIRNAANGPVPF